MNKAGIWVISVLNFGALFLTQADLGHERRIVQKEPFFLHQAILPPAHSHHRQDKLLASGLDCLPVPDIHGL